MEESKNWKKNQRFSGRLHCVCDAEASDSGISSLTFSVGSSGKCQCVRTHGWRRAQRARDACREEKDKTGK